MEQESYAGTWHGLFPRFVVTSSTLALLGSVIRIVELLVYDYQQSLHPLPYSPLFQDVSSVTGFVYFPFVVFALFYLGSRVRIALHRDYIPIGASIVLGAFAVGLVLNVSLEDPFSANPGYSPLGYAVQLLGESLEGALYFGVVGFCAVLLSYLRRLL